MEAAETAQNVTGRSVRSHDGKRQRPKKTISNGMSELLDRPAVVAWGRVMVGIVAVVILGNGCNAGNTAGPISPP